MAFMAHSRALATSLLFFIILWLNSPAGSKAATNTTFVYARYGVRLVGGDATKGTLELLARTAYLPNSRGEWVQVCPDFFDDQTAQMLCANLGYKLGRRTYSNELSFPTNKTASIAQINYCSPQQDSAWPVARGNNGHHHRRHLRAFDAAHGRSASGSGSGGDDSASSGPLSVMRRGLAPLQLTLDVNSSAPYTCNLRNGLCNPKGPMVALQCSNRTFPPAKPPPPSPPNPPPSPPPVSNSIRLFGGSYGQPPLEPNLCATNSAKSVCDSYYARVEMQVNSPNPKAPGKIWAPVCNITDSRLANAVAYVACSQRFQERRQPWLPGAWYIGAQVSNTPLLIPTGKNFGTFDFNPTKVGGWVTITNATSTNVQLQDTKYKVSTSPCTRSAMLAISCILMSNDAAMRRRHQ